MGMPCLKIMRTEFIPCMNTVKVSFKLFLVIYNKVH